LAYQPTRSVLVHGFGDALCRRGATIAMVAAVGLISRILPMFPDLDRALVAVAIGVGAIG